MKRILNLTTCSTLGIAALLFLGTRNLTAQDGPPPGSFDPQQMRQRMLQRMRDRLEVTDDTEWKLISERIQKVMEARRALGAGPGPRGGFMGPPGGPPPGANDQTGPGGPGGPGGPPPRGPGAFNRPPSPELEALQKAIDSKASSAELKAKIADVKTARAQKQADLEKARDDLRQLLSARQEAIAMTLGLL